MSITNWLLKRILSDKESEIKSLKDEIALLKEKNSKKLQDIRKELEMEFDRSKEVYATQVRDSCFQRFNQIRDNYTTLSESAKEGRQSLLNAYDEIHTLESKILDLEKRLRERRK